MNTNDFPLAGEGSDYYRHRLCLPRSMIDAARRETYTLSWISDDILIFRLPDR